jgi:hypothetical protein
MKTPCLPSRRHTILAGLLLCTMPRIAVADGVTCPDPGASAPDKIRIQIVAHSAKSSRHLDDDPDFIFFGWQNQNDLQICATVDGVEVGCSRTKHRDEPDFEDEIIATVEVARDIGLVPIEIYMKEKDEFSFTLVDINPIVGDRTLDLQFDPCAYVVTGDGLDAAGQSAAGSIQFPRGDDFFVEGSVEISIRTADGKPVPPKDIDGDLAVTDVDLIQVLERPGFYLAHRPAVMRVVLASTFALQSVDPSVDCFIDDGVGERTERRFTVHLEPCQTDTQYFFVDAPVDIDEGNDVVFGAQIDPELRYHQPADPPCVYTNDGNDRMKSRHIFAWTS